MDHCEAAPPNDSVPSHDATSVTYRDTDNDLIEFKLTVRGLALWVNGQAEDSWEQLEWLSWDSTTRNLTDPSHQATCLPPDVEVTWIASLASRAHPACDWLGDPVVPDEWARPSGLTDAEAYEQWLEKRAAQHLSVSG